MVDAALKTGSREPTHFQATTLRFGLYSKEEILKLSSVEIFTPVSFNQLGHPLDNGLYDLRMGPFTDRDNVVCTTCFLSAEYCPGHLGHIKLPLPVTNPMFYLIIQRLLRITCIHCHRLKMPAYCKTLFKVQMQLLNAGLISEAQEAAAIGEKSEEEDGRKKSKGVAAAEDMAMDIKLQEFVEKTLARNQGSGKAGGKQNSSTRTLESLRKDYIKTLMSSGQEKTCSRCGAVTRKIIRSKTGFLYEGLKTGQNKDEDGARGEDLMEALGAAPRRRKSRAAADEHEKCELNPKELMGHFQSVYSQDPELLNYLFPVFRQSGLTTPTDLLFMEVLPVPPPRSRPAMFADGMITMHPQSQALQNVVESAIVLKQLLHVHQGADLESLGADVQDMVKSLRGDSTTQQLDLVWKEMQNHVDHVVDKDLNAGRNDKKGWGFKQLIERKQGIFRMNMMGKRVNHAARTVITPDPMIGIDEIGLPEIFAKKLTYPVPVTPWNVSELRDLVINGPDKHPGAVSIEDENGRTLKLEGRDQSQRTMLANTLLTPSYGNNRVKQRPKIVYRHLKNGDAMLLNRQPTLHKPSIMSHKARVLKGEKVMRLHYSNCKSYNADFDGDEMNAHFLQSELARSEAYHIANSAHQYLGPRDGMPLQGLIQDHVIAGVKMTIRGRFFGRGEYMQMVFQALQKTRGRIKTLPPSILKPEMLWSGKQVISTILINLVPRGKAPPNFTSTAKIKASLWQNQPARSWKAGGTPEGNDISMTETEVVIRQGELLVGILDKNQYGATPYSLSHLFFELYGGWVAADLLSGLSKLFTDFIKDEGFTLGVQDILVTEEANEERTRIMGETRLVGESCAAQGVGLRGVYSPEELTHELEECHRSSADLPRLRMELDRGYKSTLNPATNAINSCCLPKGLIKQFPDNNLQLMVNSGAKGSIVNTMQISCLLGQIELEGKRPPVMISGKSLPSFPAYDTQPRAGGFIDGRFMTGIQPQEFFFHCMAGREGLIDTAVKTSRSGYLQRCLIKMLEGVVVNYDLTVRDSDNSVIQFQYGEDSLDVTKCQYLKPERLTDLAANMGSTHRPALVEAARSYTDVRGVRRARKEVNKWMKRRGGGQRQRSTPFLQFSSSDSTEWIRSDHEGYRLKRVGTDQDPLVISRHKSYYPILEAYRKLPPSVLEDLAAETRACPDPVAARYPPTAHFGAITEHLDRLVENYLKKQSADLDEDQFREMMYAKIQEAAVVPGEPVGILAAQSVGEPSTQMTLNTFHFAGRGEMNVTLGIPRLREILMVASDNIKTPSMDIPFRPGTTPKQMQALRLKINRVLVSDLLENVQVTERTQALPTRARLVTFRFNFLPYKYFKKNFGVQPSKVLAYMEKRFILHVLLPVLTAIYKEKKITVETTSDSDARTGGRSGGLGGDDDEEEAGQSAKRMEEAAADRAMGDQDSSDEEQEDLEGEGTDVTRKVERQGDREYEEQEDDERLMNEAIDQQQFNQDEEEEGEDKENKKKDNKRHIAQEIDDDEAIGMELDQEEDRLLQDETMSSGEPAKRRANFLSLLAGRSNLCSVVDYSFDTEKESWCEVTLSFDLSQKKIDLANMLHKAAEKGVIYQVAHLKKAFIMEEKGEHVLKTDGINIDEMLQYDRILDISRLSCNNVHVMARYYGIEAAYRTIVREVTNVFAVYGIDVDYRHLSLIADFMTSDGSYKPCNRVGMENNPSPLQQMTFETAMGFLRDATLGGKTDSLSSPSACLILGKVTKGGTGSFGVRSAPAKMTQMM